MPKTNKTVCQIREGELVPCRVLESAFAAQHQSVMTTGILPVKTPESKTVAAIYKPAPNAEPIIMKVCPFCGKQTDALTRGTDRKPSGTTAPASRRKAEEVAS